MTGALIRGESPILSLLNRADFEEEENQQTPALSSGLNSPEDWESYNEWRCYQTERIELLCTEIDYGGLRKVPTIIATDEEGRIEYDVDPTFNWDCEFTLQEWRNLIKGSPQVCFLGAFLQSFGEKESLWMLSQVKSHNGYWKEYESEAYRYAQRDLGDTESDTLNDE